MSGTPRIVEVRRNVLKHNDEIARGLRTSDFSKLVFSW